ncbi:hypothetical protein [Mycolicibacterium smegmatis]|nr:hypothetical protein [Mycolicibacterium smegmatis]
MSQARSSDCAAEATMASAAWLLTEICPTIDCTAGSWRGSSLLPW